MTSLRVVLVVAFLVSAGLPAGIEAVAGSDRGAQNVSAEEVEARRVVGRFFRSLNERRYEQTCALLAHGYFARHPGSRRLCVIGLRVGFLWSQEIRWRISGVWPDGELVVVETVAQGTPGRILLVPSNGRVRVLDVVESGSPRERRPRE